MTSDRIELETKLAMLEHTVDTLGGELHEHAKMIESLQQQIRMLVEQVRPKQADQDLGPHDAPPPHYGG